MDNTTEEQRYIEALIEGDTEAFRWVYENYAPRIKAFTMRFHFRDLDCDDIVQETFKKVWEKRETIHAWKKFNTYLISIAKHLIYNHLRHEVYVKRYEAEFQRINLSVQQTEGTFDIKKIIDESILLLPDKCRRIYRLSRIDGFTNPEIAHKLNLSISTVENQLNKALTRIKSALVNAGYTPSVISFLLILHQLL